MSSNPSLPNGIASYPKYSFDNGLVQKSEDQVVEEAPLEIQLEYGAEGNRRIQPIAVTMRTPGQDLDLALGFLFTEAIIGKMSDIEKVVDLSEQNRVKVRLHPNLRIDLSRLERHFYTSSSCGICGKGALEMVQTVSCYYPVPEHPKIKASNLYLFPEHLNKAQSIFALTGGIHAAGLFDPSGYCHYLREDVGRHNAVDKLLGAALQAGHLPLRQHILMLSGRIGFELVQKAAMAGIPIVAAVGAPSSLAIDLAKENGMTLVGFLRNHRMNVYCGPERILEWA